MDLTTLSSLIASTLVLSSPLIFAALGGFMSERGGVINIALEGKMLTAACVTALVSIHSGNAVAGAGAGVLAAILMSWLHWLLTQTYRMDHIVSGMAINALALGSTNYLSKQFAEPDRASAMPLLPLELFYGFALISPVVLWLFAGRTRGGLRLRAVGSDPEKGRQMGIAPLWVRFQGLAACGVLTGLAGALIAMNARGFSDGMTGGRGFIALAALILGGWRPVPAALACVVFGFFEALQYQFQGTPVIGIQVPAELWNSLPYLVTLVALAGFLGARKAPAGLGRM